MSERNFTIDYSSIGVKGGKFKSNTPQESAKKAAKKLLENTNKVTFCIRETTKDSKKKTYHYKATKKLLNKPTVTVKNGVKKVQYFKITVKSVQKVIKGGGLDDNDNSNKIYLTNNFIIILINKILNNNRTEIKISEFKNIIEPINKIDVDFDFDFIVKLIVEVLKKKLKFGKINLTKYQEDQEDQNPIYLLEYTVDENKIRCINFKLHDNNTIKVYNYAK